MAKLTKLEAKNHNLACELLKKKKLTEDDKDFIFDNWHEGAKHINGTAGAFFTPSGLAFDMEFDICGKRVIDLCAGIGMLSYAVATRSRWSHDDAKCPEIVCVEINPDYVEIGKKLVPEATWICGDVLDPILIASLGHFDAAYGNPPFGNVKGSGNAPRYTGSTFEFKVMDIASDIADTGTFLIPQESASFRYSGKVPHEHLNNGKFAPFFHQTRVNMDVGIGVDTACYLEDWKGVKPLCEIVCCDFEEARETREELNVSAVVVPIRAPQPQTPIIPNPQQFDLFATA